MTPAPAKVRGRGSQPRSSPRHMGPSMLDLGFRVVPLTSQYVFLCFFSTLLLNLFWSMTNLYFLSVVGR